MEFGIHIGARGALAAPAHLAAVARQAEALGYATIGIPDRLVLPRAVATRYPYTEDGVWVGAQTGECLDVLGALCFLAGITSRVRLLPSVLVVPYRPAVVAAKMLATVDVLSGGRLIAGVGVGWLAEEYAPLGAPPFNRRGAVTDAYLAAMQALWTEEAPSVAGPHVAFENLLFQPKPVQPRVPVWVGGESEAAMRRTVRFGDAWYPASHNQATPFDTPARLAAGMARLAQVAEAAGRDPATLETVLLWFKPVGWTERRTQDGARQMFTGGAADLREDAAALEAIGVRQVIVVLQAPTIEETGDRLARFAADVIAPARG
ncbi:MAG TPA: TIGR03619 family F420-dependent LLM class oxidoreductase [Acetobacteraceae bacterium]|nr:TIGR03619 family F420-dependent LLM class oxidoreductase [Acetobacteraceae bacterium]